MSNAEKLKAIFVSTLGIDENLVVDDLRYGKIQQWDSVAHMGLIAEIEDTFEVMLDTDDIIDMSSYLIIKEILGRYDVSF